MARYYRSWIDLRDWKIISKSLEDFKKKTKKLKANEIEGRGLGLNSTNFEELDDTVAHLQEKVEKKIEEAKAKKKEAEEFYEKHFGNVPDVLKDLVWADGEMYYIDKKGKRDHNRKVDREAVSKAMMGAFKEVAPKDPNLKIHDMDTGETRTVNRHEELEKEINSTFENMEGE